MFVWRGVVLVNTLGTVGLLATQSITEVDSRRLIDDVVLDKASIYRALRSRMWPGSAQVVISQLWLCREGWQGQRLLEGEPVDSIRSDLRVGRRLSPPRRVESPLIVSEGVHNGRGMALVLEPGNPLLEEPECREHIRPYVTGADLTGTEPLVPSRFVIDLTGRSEEDLESLPGSLHTYLVEEVRPTRTHDALSSYKGLAERWWTFWNTREELFGIVRQRDNCVVLPAVSKHLLAFEMPSGYVYTNKVFVFDQERGDEQVLLLSTAFLLWLEAYGGTMGTGKTVKIRDVVRTFPVPAEKGLRGLGLQWQEALLVAMEKAAETATKTLNRFHDPACDDAEILTLRARRAEIDAAVLDAYGWSDVAPEYMFRETESGTRWTVGAATASQILEHLSALNGEQSANDAGSATLTGEPSALTQGSLL